MHVSMRVSHVCVFMYVRACVLVCVCVKVLPELEINANQLLAPALGNKSRAH